MTASSSLVPAHALHATGVSLLDLAPAVTLRQKSLASWIFRQSRSRGRHFHRDAPVGTPKVAETLAQRSVSCGFASQCIVPGQWVATSPVLLQGAVAHVAHLEELEAIASSKTCENLRGLLVDVPLSGTGASMTYRCRNLIESKLERNALISAAVDAAQPHGVPVYGWIRGSLGSVLEGQQLQTILAAETAASLLSLGCSTVILEEGCSTLTASWMQVLLKTAAAVGVAPEQLCVCLNNNEDITTSIVHVALSSGITSFVGSSVKDVRSLPCHASPEADGQGDEKVSLDELLTSVISYMQLASGGSEAAAGLFAPRRLECRSSSGAVGGYEGVTGGAIDDATALNLLLESRRFCDNSATELFSACLMTTP